MRVEAIQVTTTTAEKKDAEALAQAVLESRLGACVQMGGPIESPGMDTTTGAFRREPRPAPPHLAGG